MASTSTPAVPFPYQAFFLWIEPVATLVGAFYAWFLPQAYLELTHAASAPNLLGLPISTHVVLRQLGNLYLAFVLNEALVLRATNDLKVWRTLLFGLLVADFGHLWSCTPLGLQYYYDVASWNSIAYGNILFVYCGATVRTCFLLGIGLETPIEITPAAKREIERVAKELDTMTPAELDKSPTQSTRRKKNKSG